MLDAKLTPTEVDIIFSSIKAKGERRINFREFCEGVQRMAIAKVRLLQGWRSSRSGAPPRSRTRPALTLLSLSSLLSARRASLSRRW